MSHSAHHERTTPLRRADSGCSRATSNQRRSTRSLRRFRTGLAFLASSPVEPRFRTRSRHRVRPISAVPAKRTQTSRRLNPRPLAPWRENSFATRYFFPIGFCVTVKSEQGTRNLARENPHLGGLTRSSCPSRISGSPFAEGVLACHALAGERSPPIARPLMPDLITSSARARMSKWILLSPRFGVCHAGSRQVFSV